MGEGGERSRRVRAEEPAVVIAMTSHRSALRESPPCLPQSGNLIQPRASAARPWATGSPNDHKP